MRFCVKVDGKYFKGTVTSYSQQDETSFNIEHTDMIQVGNNPDLNVIAPLSQCIFYPEGYIAAAIECDSE